MLGWATAGVDLHVDTTAHFYSHSAMLVWILAMALSVCHKSVFYRNGWMYRAGFWRVDCGLLSTYPTLF